eukprot:8717815-Pyramimonas_sp.AAC.1
MAGMPRAPCLFWCPASSACGADVEDASSEALIFAPKGGQILRISQTVCLCCWPDSWPRNRCRMPQDRMFQQAPAGSR